MPFIFAKSTEKLKFASFISFTSAITYSIVTLYNFLKKAINHEIPESVNYLPPTENVKIADALGCFSTVFLSFCFHFNFFPVYKSLSNPTDKRMFNISIASQTNVFLFF